MKKIIILIIVFIIFGTVINLIPVATYTFGNYIHEEYKNRDSNGISFEYYGIFGSFSPSNNSENHYSYGITMNITKTNNTIYYVNSNLYKVCSSGSYPIGFNGNKLPNVPFLGSSVKEIANFSGNVSKNNYPILNIIFPYHHHVRSIIGNFSIQNSSVSMSPNSYIGFPKYHFGNTTFSSSELSYVHFSDQYIMAYSVASDSNNTIKLFTSIVPYAYNNSNMMNAGPMIINIGNGNDVPTQNWLGWFELGFNYVFPLNIILLLSAGIIAIYEYRRVN